MQIFLLSLVILSIACGLNAKCVKHHASERCEERVFPEPEHREVHFIYHGETCDCPKYHDTHVEQPIVVKERQQNIDYKYDVVVPVEKKKEDETRYLFDVRVERPVVNAQERSPLSINYAVQTPPTLRQQDPQRYIYDTRVEHPVRPCDEKPWQGLVAQVDRVLMPSQGGCRNSEHTRETCDCGCRDASHTPGTCNCGNSGYALPIFYNRNSRYDTNAQESQISKVFTFPDSMAVPVAFGSGSTKSKREIVPEKKMKSKRRERKTQKLRKMSSKDLKSLLAIDPVAKQRTNLKLAKIDAEQMRLKRRPGSPCGYTFESCDPKKHNRKGCPLCYKCRCEPSNDASDAAFSPYDIRVPFKVVSHDEAPGMAATNQEFDYEPAAYTGLKDREMYKKYIQQVVSKYPEHMSRKMPDVMEQERDLMKFIGELSKADKLPGDEIQTEDIRYKLVDNAMDMYKYYERAVNKMPKIQIGSKDGKGFKKRGTVLEVIELDPNDFSGSYKIADEDSEQNVSESQ